MASSKAKLMPSDAWAFTLISPGSHLSSIAIDAGFEIWGLFADSNGSQDKLYMITERIPDGQNENPGVLGFEFGEASPHLARSATRRKARCRTLRISFLE
jgi:hypothetical protein